MDLKFRVWDTASKAWLDGQLFNIGCRFGNLKRNGFGGTITGTITEQMVGKNDSKGKPIYEGDIIEGDLFDKRLPTIGRVVFDDHFLFFASKNDAGNTPLYKVNNLVVVGNIHENPELLPGI